MGVIPKTVTRARPTVLIMNEHSKLDPVGSTVRCEMIKLLTWSVKDSNG